MSKKIKHFLMFLLIYFPPNNNKIFKKYTVYFIINLGRSNSSGLTRKNNNNPKVINITQIDP